MTGDNFVPTIIGMKTQDNEDDVFKNVKEILAKLDVDNYIKSAKNIVLKPNLVIADHYSSGNTTNPKVVEAVALYIRELNDDAIVTVADGGFTRNTDHAFKINGFPDMCHRLGLKLVNFNKSSNVAIEIKNPVALKGKIDLAREAVACDLIVSLPSLKTHSLASTTLSMKNFMGALSHKSIMHSRIHDKIVDLYSFFHPKAKFAIIDGIYGSEGSEVGGSPVKHDILLGSKDLVALDTIGSLLMGVELKECRYLFNASRRGFGSCEPPKIKIAGFNLKSFVKKYRPA
ncbi:MAG: DUF362 domain-containing protein [Promethearchaeota archaeon]